MSELRVEEQDGVSVVKRRSPQELLFASGPFATILRQAVRFAQSKQASDIHIEPSAEGIDFRVRVHGDMTFFGTFGEEYRESIILEAKRIFNIPVGVTGRPQDSRVSFPSLGLDMRVSLLPTYFGEKIVLRLLDQEARFELEALDFTPAPLAALVESTRFENGVVVISGPTGSGKSKTLYSLLNVLGPKRLNILSLEDPIEYRIKGVNQVQVSAKLSFAEGLRSALRQDPDVILVGEIRDEETAKLCFQAAETGHLVFTTLHANGSVEVTERLASLGVSAFSMKSLLRMTFAQRLETKLCPDCRIPISKTVKAELVAQVPNTDFSQAFERNHKGCDHCIGGAVGRVPVLEWAKWSGLAANETGRLICSLKQNRIERALGGTIELTEVFKDEN